MVTTTSRRKLLQSAAGVALAGSRLSAAASPALPMIKLGSHDVTRLIIGSNPFNGYSYGIYSLDHHMREWSTEENIAKTLRMAEQSGINTHQFSYNPKGMAGLKRHQAEGGKLNWILLGGGEMKDNLALIPQTAKLGPLGIVHHGGVTDQRFRAGEIDKVHTFLKTVRQSGVLVGLSTHDPKIIEYVEERNWDIDFYMACFYQFSRTKEEIKQMLGELPLGKVFLEGDPARMCKVIRATKKTCLGFKILAAGRSAESPKELDAAFRFAFGNIKPNDAVIVGMYPRFKDEVRENADIVRRVAGLPT